MKKSMRYTSLIALLLALAGCGSDKPKATADASADSKQPDASSGGHADAGVKDAGSMLKDAGPGTRDSGARKLERPNTLPRPPSGGLPAELRPPR
jgi:predicted small lipoprotein YifL